jgi:hypothetical protein
MLLIGLLMELYGGKAPTGSVEELLYLVAFVCFGVFVHRAASGSEHEVIVALRWSTLVTLTVLLIALSVSMLVNGVNPARVFAESLTSADPRVLQEGIFKSSFTGFGYDQDTVRGNLRHEVFGALLASMYVSAWAIRFHALQGRLQLFAYRTAMIISGVLLALSLSRSIIIAALLWPIIAFLRSALTLRLSSRQITTAFVVVVAALAATVSGFGQVIWVRFTEDTGSYDAREAALAGVSDRIGQYWLTGGADTAGTSSHNFLLDAWLRGGIFAALAAAVVVIIVVGVWVSLLLRIHKEQEWMVPVVAALALPIVRMATQGGGRVGVVEWVVLGFVAGVLTYRATTTAMASDEQAPEQQALHPVRGGALQHHGA